MSTPCCSIIVPVYNAEQYIKKCIESILNQTVTDLELILIDDGSTDNSGIICDDFAQKDSRIQVIHQENGGVCAARNTGIDHALGNYLSFVDSDDYLEPNALEILYNDIQNYGSDISCALMVGDNNQNANNLANGNYEIWEGTDAIKNSLLDNRFTYSSCAKLFDRNFIGETRFEVGKKIHEDSFFMFSCFLKCPTVTVRNVGVYHYTWNPSSASHAEFSEKFFDILYFANKKAKRIKKDFPELEKELNNAIIKANLAMLHMFCNTNDKTYKKDIKQCIKTVKQLKKYFVPAIPGDKKFFLVVVNNLYYLFKLYYRIRYKHN